jgi:hypothetical protein
LRPYLKKKQTNKQKKKTSEKGMGGKMTQTLYAHMNKRKKIKEKKGMVE